MLLAGSDDGVYRLSEIDGAGKTTAAKVFDSGRVLRLRTLDAFDGVFAATKTGLFHTFDGGSWTDLNVPQERVYSVSWSQSSDRLYAGTKPAHIYRRSRPSASGSPEDEVFRDDERALLSRTT